MTISILSAAASTKGVATPNGATAGADASAAADGTLFSGLFGQQLSQLAALAPQASGATAEGEGGLNGRKSAGTSKKNGLAEELVPTAQVVALQPVQAPVTPALSLDGKTTAAVSSAAEGAQDLLTALKGTKDEAADAQKLPVDGAAIRQFLPFHAASSAPAQASAEAGQTKVLSLPLPISDSNWSKSMGDQMLSLVSVKADKAQIQINPPELGPIDVTLKLNHDQVQVAFTAATPQAREAVENSLPKLATMLAASGLQLADAQVSSGQSGDPRQSQQQARNRRQEDESTVAEGNDTLSLINKARNVLSIFA